MPLRKAAESRYHGRHHARHHGVVISRSSSRSSSRHHAITSSRLRHHVYVITSTSSCHHVITSTSSRHHVYVITSSRLRHHIHVIALSLHCHRVITSSPHHLVTSSWPITAFGGVAGIGVPIWIGATAEEGETRRCLQALQNSQLLW